MKYFIRTIIILLAIFTLNLKFGLFTTRVYARPTGVTLNNSSVADNSPAGTIVGTLTATSDDSSSDFSYSLESSFYNDNDKFEIVNNELHIKDTPKYNTQGHYTIVVKATESSCPDCPYSKTLTINVPMINSLTGSFDKYTSSPNHKDISVELCSVNNTLTSISNGTETLSQGGDYTISGDGKTAVIKKEYLSSLNSDTASLNFNFSMGSEPLYISIDDSTPPGKPQITSATPGDNQALVNFSLDNTGGSEITSYTVTASPGGATATGTGSPITVMGLTNGTNYTFTVKATNWGGEGPASDSSPIVTPKGAPRSPININAIALDGQATINFLAPTDNGGSEISSYIVTSNPGNITATGTGSPIAVTGLTNGTSYNFTVQAVNDIGTGAASASSNSVVPIRFITALDNNLSSPEAPVHGENLKLPTAIAASTTPDSIALTPVWTLENGVVGNPAVIGTDYTYKATYTAPTGYKFEDSLSGDNAAVSSDKNSLAYTFTVATTTAKITSFDTIPNISAGYTGNSIYRNVAEVIAALPTTVKANGNAVTVPVSTWVDTDNYNQNIPGSYTFTATLGTIPDGYTNNENHTASIEVIVAAQPYIPSYTPPQPVTRQVPVEVDNGGQQITAVQTAITRTTASSGTTTDTVKFDENTATKAVNKASETHTTGVSINITDKSINSADSAQFQLPEASMNGLGNNNMSLSLKTEKVSLEIPKETIKKLGSQDTTVTINEEKDINKIENNKALILKLASGSQIIGMPLEIETTYTGRTKITLPIDASNLPSSKEDLDKFLSSLAVMVHHSDGQDVIDKGIIIYDEKGRVTGICIYVDKFSSFTLIEMPKDYFHGKTTVMQDKVDADKEWHVKFTKAANASTVTKDSVYVTDSKGNKVEVNVRYGSDNILIVTPVKPYTSGENYYLYITKAVKSIDTSSLLNDLRYKFIIK